MSEQRKTPLGRSGGLFSKLIYPLLRPLYYPVRHHYRLFRLRTSGLRIARQSVISMGASHHELVTRMKSALPDRLHWIRVCLDSGETRENVELYFQAHRALYEIDKGRGKALEHALGLELLDFTQGRRYCDVASGTSPIQETSTTLYPNVELWTQDMLYEDNPQHRRIGGPAQDMQSVPDAFFDALTLHNSFEHFRGDADSEFVCMVDRILSTIGACLILPLYIAATHRIYFDPVAVTPALLRTYDKGAELIPVRGFAGQEHARCYDPTTVRERLIRRLPPTLEATIIEFSGGETIAPDMFPEFALVLHRSNSILKAQEIANS